MAVSLITDLRFPTPGQQGHGRRIIQEVDEISEKQLEWLLEGLEIEQKKAHHPVDMSAGNNCF